MYRISVLLTMNWKIVLPKCQGSQHHLKTNQKIRRSAQTSYKVPRRHAKDYKKEEQKKERGYIALSGRLTALLQSRAVGWPGAPCPAAGPALSTHSRAPASP